MLRNLKFATHKWRNPVDPEQGHYGIERDEDRVEVHFAHASFVRIHVLSGL